MSGVRIGVGNEVVSRAAPEPAAELRVRGGVGGVSARLEDVESAGWLLVRVGARLLAVARALAAVVVDPGPVGGAVLSPVTFARAEAALLAAGSGPHGLLVAASRLEVLGGGAVTVARSYRAADSIADHGVRLAGRSVGGALGALATGPALTLLPVAGLVAGTVRLAPGPAGGHRFGDPLLRLLAGRAGPLEAGLPVLIGVLDGGVRAAPGGRVLSVAVFRRWSGASTPADVAVGLRVLGRVAGGPGGPAWLADGGTATVGPVRAPVPVAPAGGIADLIARIPASVGTPKIHVERVDLAGGRRRWVVYVPGTASWAPVAGSTPFDLSGDVQLMSGARSAGMSAVGRALEATGAGPGEPVLLVGHSQGGLIAAATAADPALRARFTVTGVLTSGAPIASLPVPGEVQVLSLEHDDDLVPRLDGAAGADRPNRVTVSAPAPVGALPPADRAEPLVAHRAELYRRTAEALDASTDPSIRAWRNRAAPFLDGEVPASVVGWDLEVERVSPGVRP